MEYVPVMGHDDGIRCLDHRVLESLLDAIAADIGQNASTNIAGTSTIESQLKKPRAACIGVRDAEVCTQASDAAAKLRSVVQLDVIDPEANVIQKVRTERMAPIHYIIINRSIRKARA